MKRIELIREFQVVQFCLELSTPRLNLSRYLRRSPAPFGNPILIGGIQSSIYVGANLWSGPSRSPGLGSDSIAVRCLKSFSCDVYSLVIECDIHAYKRVMVRFNFIIGITEPFGLHGGAGSANGRQCVQGPREPGSIIKGSSLSEDIE